jgi:hypothetical protein
MTGTRFGIGEAGMGVFTDHVRALVEQGRPDYLDRVLRELGKILYRNMRRRGLWSCKPSLLGDYGGAFWQVRSPEFDGLVKNCYSFAITERLHGLYAQLKQRPSIDSYVVGNVDKFLIDKQRTGNPVGYAVFKNIEGGIRKALDAGRLEARGLKRASIRGDTLLVFVPAPHRPEIAPRDRLLVTLQDWPRWHVGLPDLGAFTEDGVRFCYDVVLHLGSEGTAAFFCKDLVDIGKQQYDLRLRRHLTAAAEDRSDRVRHSLDAVASNDRLDHLFGKLREKVEGLGKHDKVRRRLKKIVDELAEDLPSQADLARRLAVPASTLNDDYKILRELLLEVLDENSDES